MESEKFKRPSPADLLNLIPAESIDTTLLIKSFDKWVKGDEIGNGRYGKVYHYQTPMDSIPECAGKHLKRMQLWNLNDEGIESLKKRLINFIDELNMLHKVSREYSERIVQFVGCHWESKKIILFTELMSHGSVKEHIVHQPLDESVAVKYFYQAAEGLRFLHHHKPKRIVHRDIKCDNLLLTKNYDVKLADFGLAHYLAVDDDSNTMSMDMESAGTPLFTAPEVLIGEKYGRRADIWSLACTLVEMLTQHPPHWEFKKKHRERTNYLLVEKARSDSEKQLKYSGHLVPSASESVRRLLSSISG
uniref:Protein kinase domain-containing protein n=1 Tax=Plectus sambesii TaxID=2011161 RepID=A0A914WHA7_9BILA